MAQRRQISEEARATWAESVRRRKPRQGRGLVAPVFVRGGVPGKACVKCLVWKPLDKFGRHATCAGGRRNVCGACEGRRAYAANPAKCIANVRASQERHKDAHLERKRAGDRIRHRRKSAGAGVPVAEYRAIKALYGGLCAYCGVAPGETMDHVIPLSRGGLHEPGNIVPACKACNFAKHDKTPDEWRACELAKMR